MVRLRATARWRDGASAGSERTLRAVDARLPVAESVRATARKAFPDHWSFLLGELALYSFAVLLLTGVYLTLFFDPAMAEVVYRGSYRPMHGVRMSEAFASTLAISFDVRGGLLIRQVHHWAALVFVAAITVHLLRVFFTGAFRKPREPNWMVGVTLFLLALLEGFCGYSLPDDLLSGTGLRIAQGVIQSVPVAGTYLSFLVFGGEYPGEDIVPRLYVAHVLLLPGLLAGLVVLHLLLVFRLRHTQWPAAGRTNGNVVGRPLYPRFSAASGGLFFLVFGVLTLLGALAQINPVWAYGPYRPDHISAFSQPDWYIGFLEGSLRLMPPAESTVAGHTLMWNVLVPAVLLPAALFAVLYLFPLFERWIVGQRHERHLCDRPRNRPVRTGLGSAGIVFYAVLLLAGGNDVLAVTFDLSLNALTWVFRVLLVLGPPAAFMVTKRLCLALQERDRQRLEEGDETGRVRQGVDGSFEPEHAALPAHERYPLVTRDVPRPAGGTGGRRRDRLRALLNGWYCRARVDMPTSAEERRAVAARTPRPRRDGDGK